MHSFLMLPMQRITRLPLLTDAIICRLPSDSSELEAARKANTTQSHLAVYRKNILQKMTTCNWFSFLKEIYFIFIVDLKQNFKFV
jgi:hypothetical protein